MEIEPKFREKRVIHRKKQFGESVDCGEKLTPEESFRIEYFLFIVDQVISSFTNRFEQFETYANIFGFLFNFKKLKSLDECTLKKF